MSDKKKLCECARCVIKIKKKAPNQRQTEIYFGELKGYPV